MKNSFYAFLLTTSVCGLFVTSAMAGTTGLTESLTDKIKCTKIDGVSSCAIETTGKFSATAKISGDTFEERGISLNTIDRNTIIAIAIGGFSFSKSLGAADILTLNSNKLSAKWSESHESCKKKWSM